MLLDLRDQMGPERTALELEILCNFKAIIRRIGWMTRRIGLDR